ncbi:MAG: hypothetical protein AB9844_05900 [Clostridiaceae bacterium]
MNLKKVIAYTLTAVFTTAILTSCSAIDSARVMVGLKNNDFEYIKQNKVKEITIQSIRDPGYRFVVSDQGAISELYDVLSSASGAYQKSSLDPDYILEMDEGNGTVYKFKYVASAGNTGSGNLYSNTKIYTVTKRLDNDIIKNFWNIRKPKSFEDIYYNSLMEAMSKYYKGKDKSTAIGVNLKDDIEVAKFILSADLEDFQEKLRSKYKNAEILKATRDKYDVLVTIKTQGYKSTLYKAIVTFWDKNAQTEEKYYIFNKYENGSWDINITKDKPEDF